MLVVAVVLVSQRCGNENVQQSCEFPVLKTARVIVAFSQWSSGFVFCFVFLLFWDVVSFVCLFVLLFVFGGYLFS